ncbi:hypothetical protein LY76DRAFT_595144, partial [Colletotrichum caudatum]
MQPILASFPARLLSCGRICNAAAAATAAAAAESSGLLPVNPQRSRRPLPRQVYSTLITNVRIRSWVSYSSFPPRLPYIASPRPGPFLYNVCA